MIVTAANNRFYQKRKTINLNGRLIDLSVPLVMGIINVTPDSFYDKSRYQTTVNVVDRALQIIDEGGSIIDLGAMSTRPGAVEISVDEELNRLLPAVVAIRKALPDVCLSIDTYRPEVVEKVYERIGSFIVNDISGGEFDSRMFQTVATLNLPYILMHNRGKSDTMQQLASYSNVIKEVIFALSDKLKQLKLLGVSDIIVDPGFGFAKTIEHNYQLLNGLDAFRLFELPILVGVSRKTMIWKELGITPQESLNGTTVLNTLALAAGCDLLRVHDVREAFEAVRLLEKLKQTVR